MADGLIHENYLAALERVTVLGPGGETQRLGPWLLLDAGLDFDYYNIAALARPAAAGASSASAIQQAIGWFDVREKPFRLILRDPADRPLIEAAFAAGFQVEDREPAMLLESLDGVSPAPGALRISHLANDEEADVYAAIEPEESGDLAVRRAISRGALRIAGCSLFVGREGTRAVASSMGLVTGRMVGVYNVFVQPAARGLGYGEAMTAAVLHEGRAHGATAACLTSTAVGVSLYQRMGFRTRYHYVSLWRPG